MFRRIARSQQCGPSSSLVSGMLLDRLIEKVRPETKDQPKPRTYKWFFVAALIALVIQSGMLFLAFFGPTLPYDVHRAPADQLDSPQFVHTLEALTAAHLHPQTRVEVLTNGDVFYPAELAAIRAARRTVNLEAYIFADGKLTDQFIQALTERARNGVKVKMVLDAIGSLGFNESKFEALKNAGGRVAWYHPVRWHTWPRINNRTHRELLVIDGKVGFVGGAGFADQWMYSSEDDPQWRDTMVRVEGGAVTGLQATFAENWLEAAGEIIAGKDYFPFEKADTKTMAMVVGSTPTSGASTSSRVLFQTLFASAKKTIHITTPYFLPDPSIRAELTSAIRERGVEVKIIVPGKHSDHLLTRRSSRRLYGDLLRAGAQIHEYSASMNHTKSLIVDGMWSVVGSTNMDSRSFALNDEVNLAMLDPEVAARLDQDFNRDLTRSRQVTYEEWSKRPLTERVYEWFGGMLERQQ